MMWMISLVLATQLTPPPVTGIDAVQESAYALLQPTPDPADSLMRVASARMARGDYRDAASLYKLAARIYPTSMRRSESMYYEAFALYRAGDLSRARSALDALRRGFPEAAARGDANALRTRICGELAKQGDSDCAEEVTRVSASASVPSAAAVQPVASVPSVPSVPSVRAGMARTSARAVDGCPDGDDDEDDTRIAALNALLQMDGDRAIPILKTVLARRDRCSERLRRKAVFLVAQKQSTESANILLAAARNDPDSEVRQQSVFWLSQVKDPRAVDMLVDIVNGDGDRALRERALFALSQHSSGAAAAALRAFAENDREPRELRERAIFSLGQRDGAEQTQYLRGLYRKLSEPELRERVLFALTQRRGNGNEAFILAIANDAREPMQLRKKAIFNAGQMGIDVAQIATLYSTLDDRELREQVIFALSQRRESAALDKLMEVAKSDPDRELRKKAIFWLGQSRDPRATAFLAELINK